MAAKLAVCNSENKNRSFTSVACAPSGSASHCIGNNVAAKQRAFCHLACKKRKQAARAARFLAAAFLAMPPPVATLLPRPKNPTRQHGLTLYWLVKACPKLMYRVIQKVGFYVLVAWVLPQPPLGAYFVENTVRSVRN